MTTADATIELTQLQVDERRARVGLPSFADRTERLRRHGTNASSLSACLVVVPCPVVERPAA